MNRIILTISIFFVSLLSVVGQDIKVTAAFDTSRIYIGDQIKFKIVVNQPADLPLTIVSFKDSLVRNVEILSGPVVDTTRKSNGAITVKHEYLITSFDAGEYQLSPVYAELENNDGVKRFYSDYTYLEALLIDIAPADSTAKIFDIINPYKAPLSAGEILPWALIVLLIGALAYYAFRLYKKYKNKETPKEIITPSEPAHVIAFGELEKLKDEELWQKGEIKLYYTRLTEILRQYLENRFGVNSLELTTYETLSALLRTGFKKDENFGLLKQILEGADMVKFAKFFPTDSDNEASFQDAWNFIDNTKQLAVETATIPETNNAAEGGKK